LSRRIVHIRLDAIGSKLVEPAAIASGRETTRRPQSFFETSDGLTYHILTIETPGRKLIGFRLTTRFITGGCMGTPSMGSNLGQGPARAPVPPPTGMIPDSVKTFVLFILVVAVGYLLFDNYQFQQKSQADITKLSSQITVLQNLDKASEARLLGLKEEVSGTQQAVGSTKAELKKTAQQVQAAKSEADAKIGQVSEALSSKADASQVQAQVQAARTDAESKIGQVSTEVGGVKTEVGAVKTDLANTKRDLEGTQRQLVDVRETLTAAVAKNASELGELRRKGEKDYVEFEIPKKNQLTKVEDIRLLLRSTDPKKGRYNLQIIVDDNKLEKKDRGINEPIQFLVGRNRVRYEIVVNWVQKDKAGGYLAIPKDKSLGAERPAKE
jgi:predicted  nucleic acid-binding Zn-ribbon protein